MSKDLTEVFEARQRMPADDLMDAIALAIRDFVVAGNPGLVNFAENWPRYWNDQAIAIAVALRERFDITVKS